MTWSRTSHPDGQTIVFHSRRDGGGIYVVPALGGKEKLIAPDGMQPRFSPNSSEIAYWVGQVVGLSAAHLNLNSASSVMTVSTSGLSPVSRTAEFTRAQSPEWLDDGLGLVIEGIRTSEDATDWWIVPLDGTPARPTGAYQIGRDFVEPDLGAANSLDTRGLRDLLSALDPTAAAFGDSNCPDQLQKSRALPKD